MTRSAPAPGQRAPETLAQAAAGAGDQGDFSGEIESGSDSWKHSIDSQWSFQGMRTTFEQARLPALGECLSEPGGPFRQRAVALRSGAALQRAPPHQVQRRG